MLNYRWKFKLTLILLILLFTISLWMQFWSVLKTTPKKDAGNTEIKISVPVFQMTTAQQNTSVVLVTASDGAETIFARRRAKTDQVCARLNPSFRELQKSNLAGGLFMDRTVVSLDKHAVMCYTLKAGSSSWNDVFWHLREPEVAKTVPFYGRAVYGNSDYYKGLTKEQRIELYTHPNALRMMTIRHPFARLISAWDDKFTKKFYYEVWFKVFPEMKNYPNLSGNWTGEGHFMPFESYMAYVADYGFNQRYLDEHFKRTSCDPCEFPFDIIVKVENSDKTSDWILKKLEYDTSLQSLNKGSIQLKPEYKIREMFSKLKRETVEKLLKIYGKEMELFGYTFDLDTLTAGGWDD